MGDNTLTSRSDGEKIPASDHNELVQMMQIDIVPRNNSRAAQDIIGQLGTSVYRWLKGYIKEIFVGTASNNLRIYEGASGELWIENGNNDRVKITDGAIELHTNGVKRFDVTDSGVNWGTIPSLNIPIAKIANRNVEIGTSQTDSNAGSTGAAMGSAWNFTVVANRQYLLILDFSTLTFDGSDDDMWIYIDAVQTFNWTTGQGLSIKQLYTPSTSGTKSFQFWGRGLDIVNGIVTLVEM